jgi:hypothetical protein
MVLKRVLGFATTTSLILLVMVAPTTTATASLQQQEGNATIDEPNIPIGPADEGPDEPIPNNENETRNDDDDDIMCALGEGSDEDNPCGDCGGRGACATIPIENDTDDNPDTWINWVKTTIDGHRVRTVESYTLTSS